MEAITGITILGSPIRAYLVGLSYSFLGLGEAKIISFSFGKVERVTYIRIETDRGDYHVPFTDNIELIYKKTEDATDNTNKTKAKRG